MMTEEQIEARLHGLRSEITPSEELHDRVSRMAAAADARQPQPKLSWIAGAFAATAVAAAAAGIAFFTPEQGSARTLQKVAVNLSRASGYHYRFTPVVNGRDLMTSDVWMAGGKARQDDSAAGYHREYIWSNGSKWTILPSLKLISFEKETWQLQSAQEITDLQAQIHNVVLQRASQYLGTEVRAGRKLQKIAVPSDTSSLPLLPAGKGREVYWIDMDRMLPVTVEKQTLYRGQWTTGLRLDFDLDSPISDSVFAIPKKGYESINLENYGAVVGRRFARPIATKAFAARTIAVRSMEVNAEGDVFILYTDGSGVSGNDPNQETFLDCSTDDRGTVYALAPGAINPYMASRGITIGKEIVSGACFIPVKPMSGAWSARKFNIEIHFNEPSGNAYHTRYARFTLPVHHATDQILPSYGRSLTALELSGGDLDAFREACIDGRCTYYYGAQDWKALDRSACDAIRTGTRDFNFYGYRVHALTQLGRLADARAALKDATAQDLYAFHHQELDEYAKEIDAAERKRL